SVARISSGERPWSRASFSIATSARVRPLVCASWIASDSDLYTLPSAAAHAVEPPGPTHPVEAPNLVAQFFAGRFVALDHHERIAAALFSRQLERRDVDVV